MSKLIRYISIFLLILGGTSLQAQVDDPETSFDILRTMEGVWFMPDERGDRLEIWEVLNDSTMIGRGVRVRAENGDSILLESIWLERRDTLITYKVTVKGQNQGRQIVYTLTDAYRDEFLFENPKHDNPKKIKYILLGNRELQVTTEGTRNNRTVTEEYVFEREFNPSTVEFRLRGGLNASSLLIDGAFNNFGGGKPQFGWRPGWDFGLQMAFKGAGGFITINTELGFAGRYSHVESDFWVDTIHYVRNGTLSSTWMQFAVLPEITLRKDGRTSVILGPYYGRLIYSRARGEVLPGPDSKLFSTNNDLKKNDFGVHLGVQYKPKPRKKDLGAKIGLRANYGLTDVDNLYIRRCTDSSLLCNSRVVLRGISAYYSINLLKL